MEIDSVFISRLNEASIQTSCQLVWSIFIQQSMCLVGE